MKLFGKQEEIKTWLVGLEQAGMMAGYIGAVGLLFWQGNQWFGRVGAYWGPVLFLVLFVVSALMSTLIVFYYPYLLAFERDLKKEAVEVVAWTAGWLGVLLVGLLLGLTLV
jgi:mannose/fructose/N-acetylgalactosamine-specific phosphotransferase system component IID